MAEMTPHDVWTNPLCREVHARQRRAVVQRFPSVGGFPHPHYLSLHRYVASRPEKYYARQAYSRYYGVVSECSSSKPDVFEAYLRDYGHRLNQAFVFLGEINSLKWHDDYSAGDDYDTLRFIDQELHPTYLRLVEGVLGPLLHLPAFLSRRSRGKGTEGLSVFQSVRELDGTPLAVLCSGYDSVIRNAIAHGGIEYGHLCVSYRDSSGDPRTLATSEVFDLVDGMLDVCNGICLALREFMLAKAGQKGLSIPAIPLDELKAETDAPWWRVVGWVESKTPDMTQLVLFARADSHDVLRVLFSCIGTAALAEFFLPEFDRYFIALRSHVALPGWAAVDGRALRTARQSSQLAMEDYKDIFAEGMFFYSPRVRIPALLLRPASLWQSLRLHWPIVVEDVRGRLGLPDIAVRDVSVHRKAWGLVVRGSVVIEHTPLSRSLVRQSCRRIARAASRCAKSTIPVTSPARYLPVGFLQVGVFRGDHRARRLRGYGLGPDLVCTVRVRRLRAYP